MSATETGIIFLSNAVLSFPHIVEPHTPKGVAAGAPPKYEAEFIIPMDNPAVAQFMQVYSQLAQAKWGPNAQAVMQVIQSDRKLRCFGTGQEKLDKKTYQPMKGYANNFWISAKRDDKPQLIGPDGRPIDGNNDIAYRAMARTFYAGCRVNAAVKPWLQDNNFGRGVRCDFVAIQFLADGEPFGEPEIDVSGIFGQVAAPAAQMTPQMPGMPGMPFPGAPVAPQMGTPFPGTPMPAAAPQIPGSMPLPPFMT